MSKKNSRGGSGRRSARDPKQRVRTARRRTASSTRWLERQLNDPYVRKAQLEGYRSRAAYKLREMDERLGLIKPGMTVVDLGSAPGGWSQVAAQKGAGRVVAIDLLPMDPLPGVTFLQMDFMDEGAPDALLSAIGGEGADVVLSDMAPNTTGHRNTDHLRIMALAEAAYDFAADVLKPGGAFVTKVFQGGTQSELLQRLKKDFEKVRHIKPPASRSDSSEQYVVATGARRKLLS
ncbi:MAG: RlmE family RNA methyltransferase [Proteobacteria bacterium]|nr:RlmE family RNA methyltransferase [Pseudomonadota bacterium]